MPSRILHGLKAFSSVACFLVFAAFSSAASPVVLFDTASEPAAFSAKEIASAFTKRGDQPEQRPLDQISNLGRVDTIVLTLAASSAAEAAQKSGAIAPGGTLRPEGFSIRVARGSVDGQRQVWVLGYMRPD